MHLNLSSLEVFTGTKRGMSEGCLGRLNYTTPNTKDDATQGVYSNHKELWPLRFWQHSKAFKLRRRTSVLLSMFRNSEDWSWQSSEDLNLPSAGSSTFINQGVATFAWRPGWQYDFAPTASADTVLGSDCRSRSLVVNKKGRSYLCDSRVAGLATRCEYPLFDSPPFEAALMNWFQGEISDVPSALGPLVLCNQLLKAWNVSTSPVLKDSAQLCPTEPYVTYWASVQTSLQVPHHRLGARWSWRPNTGKGGNLSEAFHVCGLHLIKPRNRLDSDRCGSWMTLARGLNAYMSYTQKGRVLSKPELYSRVRIRQRVFNPIRHGASAFS